ncbi:MULTISPECIES: hypothetical protein [unclassified Bradyrhizobium]|uniref:hypothetical protein n=1 Tax=unclassified Bradyrhizobium TaxID=2631580 RepID=UPI002916BB2A|nr:MULTISPECIES: hypothetical protein [unclassified Bradyrhizobium]
MTKRTFRSPPLFYVAQWKDGKWVLMASEPVLRMAAVRLVASAWKEGNIARIRDADSVKKAA